MTSYGYECKDVNGERDVAKELYESFMENRTTSYISGIDKPLGMFLDYYLAMDYFPSGEFHTMSSMKEDGTSTWGIMAFGIDADGLIRKTEEYNAKVSEIVNEMNQYDLTDREKLIYLNNRLIQICDYDDNLQNYTAYDALINCSSVCDGYAKAYYSLCTASGFPCKLYYGATNNSAYSNHAWNSVYVDGEWLYVDPTWNDADNKDKRNNYLLISKEEMDKEHKEFFSWNNPIVDNLIENEENKDV